MGHPGQWNLLAEEQVPGKEAHMALVAVGWTLGLVIQKVFELCDKPFVCLFVIRLIGEHNVTRRIQCDSVVWIR